MGKLYILVFAPNDRREIRHEIRGDIDSKKPSLISVTNFEYRAVNTKISDPLSFSPIKLRTSSFKR